MFRVVNCVLTSVGGKMQADITLSGTGYDKLYMGSKEAAASASEDQLIGYSVNAEGKICIYSASRKYGYRSPDCSTWIQ